MQDTPYGYCQCGCGERTAIAKFSDSRGRVKGEPARFIRGHSSRVAKATEREQTRAALRADPLYGLCHCGCGSRTPLAPSSDFKRGVVEGEPLRFLPLHAARARVPRALHDRYRVENRGYNTPCWAWTMKVTPKGYGRWTSRDGEEYAHRWVYMQLVGPIPEHLELDHLCHQRDCVNPEHLEPVTHAENLRRRRITKLNKESVAVIRRRIEAGESNTAIARDFGVALNTIGAIRNGRAWV